MRSKFLYKFEFTIKHIPVNKMLQLGTKFPPPCQTPILPLTLGSYFDQLNYSSEIKNIIKFELDWST